MLAALGLTVYPISVGSGTYFLSQFWNRLLTWSGIPWVSALAIVIYLVLHRDRGFGAQWALWSSQVRLFLSHVGLFQR